MEILAHLFLPRLSNNYKGKLLHHQSVLLFVAAFFLGGFLLVLVKQNFPQVLGTSTNITTEQLVSITNAKRAQNNLKPLILNPSLTVAAENKANDMFSRNYWAHVSPDGKTPWVFIKGAGYNYVYAGENLARGFGSAQDAVDAWLASPTHRENELSANYQDVGFAVKTGKLDGEDTTLIVEEFGGKTVVPLASEKPSVSSTVHQLAAPASNLTSVIKGSTSTKPLINSLTFSGSIYAVLISMFILLLSVDIFVVKKIKAVRVSGHNLDHILFLTAILLAGALLIKGVIL